MAGDAYTSGWWYLWCPRCGRVGGRRHITPATLSKLYDLHQRECPRTGGRAAGRGVT